MGPDQTQTQTCLAGLAREPDLAVRLENISLKKIQDENIFNITFSLHSHLEAFLKSAVLTLVPDKKVTD